MDVCGDTTQRRVSQEYSIDNRARKSTPKRMLSMINICFEAYQKWKNEHRVVEQRMPGLTHLNGDQLFFLNFTQVL